MWIPVSGASSRESEKKRKEIGGATRANRARKGEDGDGSCADVEGGGEEMDGDDDCRAYGSRGTNVNVRREREKSADSKTQPRGHEQAGWKSYKETAFSFSQEKQQNGVCCCPFFFVPPRRLAFLPCRGG